MPQIRIFLHSIAFLQGHAVTFIHVYVPRSEFMWDFQFVTLLRISSHRLRVLFTPRHVCIHYCNKKDKRTLLPEEKCLFVFKNRNWGKIIIDCLSFTVSFFIPPYPTVMLYLISKLESLSRTSNLPRVTWCYATAATFAVYLCTLKIIQNFRRLSISFTVILKYAFTELVHKKVVAFLKKSTFARPDLSADNFVAKWTKMFSVPVIFVLAFPAFFSHLSLLQFYFIQWFSSYLIRFRIKRKLGHPVCYIRHHFQITALINYICLT